VWLGLPVAVSAVVREHDDERVDHLQHADLAPGDVGEVLRVGRHQLDDEDHPGGDEQRVQCDVAQERPVADYIRVASCDVLERRDEATAAR
jgi:hypothetical protein